MSLHADVGLADISLMDPAVQECPYPAYALMRQEEPVYRMPETGFYVVTRYRDLQAVLRDTTTYSNMARNKANPNEVLAQAYKARGWVTVPTLQQTDPPQHARYRRPIDRAFTASRVKQMVSYIDGIVEELIDDFISEGETDFVQSFAVPLPCYVIADQFGVPREDVPKLKLWSDALMDSFGMMMSPERELEVADQIIEMQHYWAAALEERRVNPRDDMLSDLVHIEEGEEPLTMNELLDTMGQLLTGGNDTTTGSLAEGLLLLIQHPDQQQVMRDDPSLIKNFVEEALRVESPVQGLLRTTTCETELGGTVIPEGSVVICRYASANRDETRFDDAESFDCQRKDAGAHLSFGAGAHFCPGAMLARQEMISAFTQLLARVDNFELTVPESTLSHYPSLFHRRLKALPIRFTAR
ncbi:MAG: cytochrome P450 [Proteobacteria bacterium]|nr:cytochrome P450 [Pseudomonadota bacterium]